ncbi:MAG: hypothetical protein JNJ50_29750 [Acidobacteria bacterium]|nr:hypothetical protein [Acidobacteriota bacterium]
MRVPTFQHVWRTVNWRALAALALLLLSWSASPVSLLASEPDYCAMECCVADGHCCCASRKLYVAGEERDEHPTWQTARLEAPCPCPATPASTASFISRQVVSAVTLLATTSSAPILILRDQGSLYRSFRASPDSSRAPPVVRS